MQYQNMIQNGKKYHLRSVILTMLTDTKLILLVPGHLSTKAVLCLLATFLKLTVMHVTKLSPFEADSIIKNIGKILHG